MTDLTALVLELLARLRFIGVEARVANNYDTGHKEAMIILPGYRWDETHKKLVKRKGT